MPNSLLMHACKKKSVWGFSRGACPPDGRHRAQQLTRPPRLVARGGSMPGQRPARLCARC
eukprot:scaffold3000_cov134-Isochrysis_galbana.AAC.2